MRGARWAWVAWGWLGAACSFAQDPTPGSPPAAQDAGQDPDDASGADGSLDAGDGADDLDLDADDLDPDADDAGDPDPDTDLGPDADLDADDAGDLDLDADADAEDVGGVDLDVGEVDLDAPQDEDAPDAQEPFLWAPTEEPPRCPAGQHDDGAGGCVEDAPQGLWAWFDAWTPQDDGLLPDESGAGHPLTLHGLAPLGGGSLSFEGRAEQWASLGEAGEVWGGDFTLVLRAAGRDLARGQRYGLASARSDASSDLQALSWRLYVEDGRVVWQVERGEEVLLRLAGDDEPLTQRDGAALVLRRQGDALGLWVGSQPVAQAGLPASTPWDSAPLLLGAESYDPSAAQVASPWEGDLLELAVFRRALSEQEVASLLPREGLPLACAQGHQDDGEGRCRPSGVCALSRSPAGGALCLPERGLVRRYAMERAELCGEQRCTPNEGAERLRTPDFALYLPQDAQRASTGGLDSALKLAARPATARAQDLPSDNSDRTVALWVRAPLQGQLGASPLVRYGNDGEGNKVELRLERTETGLRLWVDVGEREAAVALPSGQGAWRHLAYTYHDGEDDAHKLWVDGRAYPLGVELGELDTRWGEDDLLWLGPLGDLGGGSLDEVRIYERALSVEEVQALYEGGRPTRCLDGWHHDGRGGCAREGLCAQGRWEAGDGLCLPHGECAQGYALDARGVCVLAGSDPDLQTCQEVYDAGGRRSGVYHLWSDDPLDGRGRLVQTYCEQGWGGGWALAARGAGRPGDFGFDGLAWDTTGETLGALPALLPEDAVFPPALRGEAREVLLVLEHPPGSGRFEGQRIALEESTSRRPLLARLGQCGQVEADLQGLLNGLFLGLDASGGDSCQAARCNFDGASGRGRLGLQATALDCAPRLLGGVGLTVPNVPISAGLVEIAPSGFTSWRAAAFYLYAR